VGFVISISSIACDREPCGDTLGPSARLDQGLATCNATPIARASARLKEKTIELSAAESTDANSDPLTYTWKTIEAPPGSVAQIADPNAMLTELVADAYGAYAFELIVSDGELESVPIDVSLGLRNRAPAANAGGDRDLSDAGIAVELDGTQSSDPDGEMLSYAWTVIDVPRNSAVTSLMNASSARPSFVPDIIGIYDISLRVSDGMIESEPDIVRVRAGRIGTPPIARAGEDISTELGIPVVLDGRESSDGDGDQLTFAWRVASGPVVTSSISNPSGSRTTFTPGDGGLYTIELTVSDGVYDSIDTLEVMVTISLLGTDVFLPEEVYVLGSLDETSVSVPSIAHWATPNMDSVGLDGLLLFQRPYIRPTDGKLIYARNEGGESDTMRQFVADAYKIGTGDSYPDAPSEQDPIVLQLPCPSVPQFMTKMNGETYARCMGDDLIYNEAGVIVADITGMQAWIATTDNDHILYTDPGAALLIRTGTGTPQMVDMRGEAPYVTRLSKDQQSFMMLYRDELMKINLDGTVSLEGTYPAPPAIVGGFLPGMVDIQNILDGNFDLFTRFESQGFGVITVRRLDGTAEIVYDSRAVGPRVKLGTGGFLFTGP
jgi:hypothetical protein